MSGNPVGEQNSVEGYGTDGADTHISLGYGDVADLLARLKQGHKPAHRKPGVENPLHERCCARKIVPSDEAGIDHDRPLPQFKIEIHTVSHLVDFCVQKPDFLENAGLRELLDSLRCDPPALPGDIFSEAVTVHIQEVKAHSPLADVIPLVYEVVGDRPACEGGRVIFQNPQNCQPFFFDAFYHDQSVSGVTCPTACPCIMDSCLGKERVRPFSAPFRSMK